MTLLDSFFAAMIRLDGDTLVMQVGQKPYLVRAASTYRGPVEWGQVELSTRPLTLDAGLAMLEQILPADQRKELADFGAVEYEFAPEGAGGERFTMVAARGGDDIWVEIRRRSRAPELVAAEPVEEQEHVVELYADEALEKPSDARAADPARAPEPEAPPEPERPFLVVPLRKNGDTHHFPELNTTPPQKVESPRVEQLLRKAIEAGASSLFLIADMRPMMRVNGGVRSVGADPARAADIRQFAAGWSRTADDPRWEAEIPELGRFECLAVDDYRGPGLTIHIVTPGLTSADHLGLPEAFQAVCDLPDGFVLVASPRAGGKSTLVHAFVDVINRTRSDHVVCIESRIGYRHESQHSFISQRETRGDGEAAGLMLRAALREGPDVLVVDDLRGPEAVAAAIDAARAGRLVFATIAARSIDEAKERLLDAFPPARKPPVRALLSGILRAGVAQVLVKSVAGPLVAAREMWLSSPEQRTSMQESLVQLVREGRVNPSDALRAAPHRELFAAALHEEGFEASGERLA